MDPLTRDPVAPGLLNCTSIIRLMYVRNAVDPINDNVTWIMLHMRSLFVNNLIIALLNSGIKQICRIVKEIFVELAKSNLLSVAIWQHLIFDPWTNKHVFKNEMLPYGNVAQIRAIYLKKKVTFPRGILFRFIQCSSQCCACQFFRIRRTIVDRSFFPWKIFGEHSN